ncbi:MAG: cytochrome c oxidase assembly protein [Paracoccaceae bacterium]
MKAPNKNSALALRLLALVVFMVGMSFAAVPLYDLFCKVTGFGGTTSRADAGSETILNETISIRFDASIDPSMGWEFRPAQRAMDLRIGETGLAFYEAYNPTDHPIAGQAVYNVTPFSAGSYFTKIDCFCFTEQLLMPGERVMMPVTFYVDPEILIDAEGKFVQEITLSYAFGEIELTEEMRLRVAEAARNDENVPIN